MSQIETFIKIAKAEVGYLEKASNKNLDSKTANAALTNLQKRKKGLLQWGIMVSFLCIMVC